MEANENDNTTAPNLWDAEKVVIRGKNIAIQAFQKKKERSHTQYNLTPQRAGKEQQIKPKTSRRQEIIKTRAETNAIKTQTNKQTNQNRSMKPEAGSLKELTKSINH